MNKWKKSVIGKYIKTVIITLIFVFAIAATFFITKNAVTPNEKLSGQTIKHTLSNISTLNSAEYHYTHVESYDSGNRKLWGLDVPLTSSKAIFTYEGTITAGIDFSKIDVIINDLTITIRLPQSSITGSEIDPTSLKNYYEKNNLFNPMTVDSFNKMLVDIKEKEETAAIESGLLTWADNNVKRLIENFIKGVFDVDSYKIVFETQDADAVGSVATPEE